MSYILDALTKAAQQRDRQVPAVQRLLTRAPISRSAWTRSPGRLIAALTINAVLLTLLLVWWLRPVPVAAPPDSVPMASVPVAGPTTVDAGRPLRIDPPKADIASEKAAPARREAIAGAPPDVARPKPERPASPPSPRPAASVTQPAPVAAPPAARVAPTAPPARTGLKLEALIYSDLPAQRMIFVNGRRYVEGDVIDGRLRVEEIQENGVELSDQGRRFTLRVER